LFFDRFKFEPGELRRAFSGYPGMEHTLDTLDYEYIGERKAPLRVSPGDTCLATVWYSAYLAHSIMQKLGNRPFLYLIQDYEANFYAANAWFALAERTYHLNYHALFSTAALEQFFVSRDVGGLVSRQLKRIHFNNSCACSLPDRDAFFARGANGRKRMFAFYCRPAVDRNMFELGALTLVESVGAGIFDPEQWDFRGIGLGKCTIQLAKDLYLRQMPRMNLKDYLKSISEYDLGLTLMGSPHPSLVPFDLAGSGAVVVTNSFANKNQLYFSGLAPNVICREPHLDALMDGLAEAVARTEDLEARYDAALQMKYPKSWDETWTPEHQSFIASVLG
jgi:hypothetical protein